MHTLETKRLTLRMLRESDLAAHAEMVADLEVDRVTYRLSEDDCLAIQLNAPTAFRNRTRKPARYLVTIATERSGASRRRK